jgi:hypothetical protein
LISPGVSQFAYGSLAFRSRMVARHTTRRIDDFTHITNELAAQARGLLGLLSRIAVIESKGRVAELRLDYAESCEWQSLAEPP